MKCFLAQMGQVMPWSMLEGIIEPHYPKAVRRRGQPMLLGTMLRIHFMQQWYSLSDSGMEDALYEIESMRRFAWLDLGDDALLAETAILNFHPLPERHDLSCKLPEAVNVHLGSKGLLPRQGTIVDAIILHAPSSTKNKDGKLHPDMRQTKGQPVFLRHEGAHRRRRGLRLGTYDHSILSASKISPLNVFQVFT